MGEFALLFFFGGVRCAVFNHHNAAAAHAVMEKVAAKLRRDNGIDKLSFACRKRGQLR